MIVVCNGVEELVGYNLLGNPEAVFALGSRGFVRLDWSILILTLTAWRCFVVVFCFLATFFLGFLGIIHISLENKINL
jgi:hypothetical protein